MTVRELVKELSQIPDDYEVQVTLTELAGPDATKEEEMQCMESVVANPAFIFSTYAYDKGKTALISGCALPESGDSNFRYNPYADNLTVLRQQPGSSNSNETRYWIERTKREIASMEPSKSFAECIKIESTSNHHCLRTGVLTYFTACRFGLAG